MKRDAPVDPAGETVASEPPPPPGDDEKVDALVGRRLRHFRIEALLGRGGMGAVYRAFDESLERPVALKVLLRDDPNVPELRARFLREARAQAKIRHPNVVPIHFVGEDEGIAFLVMDLIEGESLETILAREGRMAPERALHFAEAVTRALEAGVEQGLVHRDVKPSNVMVDRRGHVLLADFGLAKQMGADVADSLPGIDPAGDTQTSSVVLTRAGALVGTPTYMAPEQARGERIDHRADIYALGITLYECLTGQPPFTAPSHVARIAQHLSEPPMPPRTLVPEMRPSLEQLVLRMIAKSPGARFASYAELRDALDEVRDRALEPGSFVARAVAAVVDLFVAIVPAALLSYVYGPLLFPFAIVVLALIEGRFGTTLGKRLLRLRTVGPHDAPVGYARALARNAIKLSGMLLVDLIDTFVPGDVVRNVAGGVILLAWVVGFGLALGRRGQALHDRVAATRVVYGTRERNRSRPVA